MTLAESQRAFWQLATQSPDVRSELLPSQLFISTPQLDARSRIGIYADMFLWRQVDCLRDDFPKLAALHGDFYGLAQAYLALHPSRHHSLARLGHALSQFLTAQPQLLSRADLSDLAALEWARAEVFEEAAAAILTTPGDFEQALTVIPALRLLELDYDAAAVWQAIEAGVPSPEPCRTQTTVVVWRKEFEVFHVRLDECEAIAFKRAREGAGLVALCEAFEQHENPIEAAYRAIASWFAEGWFVDTH